MFFSKSLIALLSTFAAVATAAPIDGTSDINPLLNPRQDASGKPPQTL